MSAAHLFDVTHKMMMKFRKVAKKSAMMLRRHGLCFSTTAPGTSNTVPGSQQHVGMKPEYRNTGTPHPSRAARGSTSELWWTKQRFNLSSYHFVCTPSLATGRGDAPLTWLPFTLCPSLLYVNRGKQQLAQNLNNTNEVGLDLCALRTTRPSRARQVPGRSRAPANFPSTVAYLHLDV